MRFVLEKNRGIQPKKRGEKNIGKDFQKTFQNYAGVSFVIWRKEIEIF